MWGEAPMQGVQHVQGFSSYNNKSVKSLKGQMTLHTLQPLGWQSQDRRQSRCGQNNNNNYRPFNRYGLGQMTCCGGVTPAHLRDEPKLVGRSEGQEACYEQHLDD